MKFEMQLTQKDKKLLVMLSVIVILALFGFLAIRPLAEKNMELSTKLEDEQNLQMENEQKISMLPTMHTTYDDLEKSIAAERAVYYPIMQSNDIDKLLTDKSISYGLNVQSLNIVMPKDVVSLETYTAGGKIVVQESTATGTAAEKSEARAADAASQLDEGTTTETVAETPAVTTGIYAVNVSMSLTGSRSSLQALLDDIYDNYSAIRVTSFSWGETTNNRIVTTNGTSEVASDTTQSLNLTMDVYMCEGNE